MDKLELRKICPPFSEMSEEKQQLLMKLHVTINRTRISSNQTQFIVEVDQNNIVRYILIDAGKSYTSPKILELVEEIPLLFPDLLKLYCDITGMWKIPVVWGSLRNLILLRCGNDLGPLQSFPFSSLCNLKYLELWGNFSFLPESIGALQYLEEIHIISCHKLKNLPLFFMHLPSLQNLHIRDCPQLTISKLLYDNLCKQSKFKFD
ncbi:hypothetical protein NEF87_001249 [Candidatus Lokiarchaeum ossiferum]|uniref:Leucine-rich repeat domain-containing protein n=1 Tax=Candidatus Lokiarchaeum ossiferum TaxID=2951803 RepID=A0ABY6HN73_9ARCH|nr:hypothetical protein NEF87_001249 [Candidatus Lokiarchaeum sp. B-35]